MPRDYFSVPCEPPYTCPDIDKALRALSDHRDDIGERLEELRKCNSALRDWGEEIRSEANNALSSLQDQLDEARSTIKDLETQVEDLADTIKQDGKTISSLEAQIERLEEASPS